MLRKILIYLTLATTALVLTCCASSYQAPIHDRLPTNQQPDTQQPSATENIGDEYYTVQPGDGLYRLGIRFGVSTADLVAWNNLENEHVLNVGQQIRVTPPTSAGNINGEGVVVTPIPSDDSITNTPTPKKENIALNNAEIKWKWPTTGAVISTFTQANRGISIDGKIGSPVKAAASGRVVFAGNSVPGLGNLIIIQHNGSYLSAYAHNQALLVKEDQKVTQGQKIAEMGKSDSTTVKLHFEIRKNGQPVDPLSYLPRK